MNDRTETVRFQPPSDQHSQLCLRLVSGQAPREPIVLAGQTVVIGRDPEVDLPLPTGGVSRRHAKLTCGDGGQYTIIDLGSKNGTFVNGTSVDVAPLRPGDRIDLGKATLELDWLDAPEPAKPDAGELARSRLSARELEVAELVGEGLTNAEIGRRLGISRRTVATHLENAYQRLDIHSRAALVRVLSGGGGG